MFYTLCQPDTLWLCHPPTLLRCGMDGGLRRTMNFAPAQYANILFMWSGIKQNTVPTAAQRWTEVTTIALWHEQEQMMDIGDMVTIFVAMGGRKMCNEQIPLPYIKAYRKALRDVVDWLERQEQQMKAYKLTTGKDYMAFLRMFRDAPDNLMEMGGFADEYRVPDECKDKVKKVIEKRKEK